MIKPAGFAEVLVVASTMRDIDREEIFATRFVECAEDIAREAVSSPYCWVYGRDETLIAAFGFIEMWPGVWSAWMFANDLWDAAAGRAIVRFVRMRVFDQGHPTGMHRIECRSLADRVDAHKFIRAVGMKEEHPERRLGKAGQDFIVFAMTP
jgi:hypothetical protein